MERVMITGVGAITCHGSGTDALWKAMSTAAVRSPDRVPDPDAHMNLPLWYLVPNGDVPTEPAALGGSPLGRATRFALEATRQAVIDAGLADALPPPGIAGRVGKTPFRLGVVVGTCMGEPGHHDQWRGGERPPTGRWSPGFVVSSVIGDQLGAVGANVSVANACAASGYAIGIAADMIRAGEADVVVAGGVEAYSRVALACFNRLGAVDPVRCRPFDLNRQGTVFGEGAAVLVLESESHAHRRGVAPYAHLAGSGWSCDAHHATAPEPAGEQIMRAMRGAMEEAGAGPGRVGCVIPHGTGTRQNDVVESHALQEVFGDRCPDIPLYSLKGLIGHSAGAAGALAACAATMIVHRSVVPPNVPIDEQDSECKVWVPRDEAVHPPGDLVLVNAYAFGGNNVSLVLADASTERVA